MPRVTTCPAEWSAAFHHYQHPFFMAHQHIGDLFKALAGQGYVENHVPSGDDRFPNHRTDLVHLPIFGKKGPIWSSTKSTGTPYIMFLVLHVLIYYVWSLIDFAISVLSASCSGSCSLTSRMTYIAFKLLASTFWSNALQSLFHADPN